MTSISLGFSNDAFGFRIRHLVLGSTKYKRLKTMHKKTSLRNASKRGFNKDKPKSGNDQLTSNVNRTSFSDYGDFHLTWVSHFCLNLIGDVI